jgi:autotransporter-associated beta strand protein
MKLKLLVAATSAVLIFQASAALMRINNLVEGAGDTLYADKDNVPMSQGIVTIGYFPNGVNPTDIPSLLANIASFTVIDSQTAGDHWLFLSGPNPIQVPGYAGTAIAQQVPGGPVTGASPLLGRTIYSIVSNAPSLAAATADNQFAMVSMGVFLDDDPSENTYIANPAGTTAIIGSFGTVFYEGENYNTLKMGVFVGPPNLTWDHDANGTASDGAGTWLNANQWLDGVTPVTWNNDTPANAIIGSGGTGGTITLGSVTAGTVLLDNFTGTYTLSGLGLAQSGGLTIGATAGDVTLSTPVSGSGALVKNNSGTLTLGAANSFSGGITVNAGSLVASTDVFLGATGGGLTFNGTCSFGNNGSWPIDAGRTITVSAGANVTFNSSGMTIRGPVVGSGTLTVARSTTGNAALTMSSTANTFTGAMNLDDKSASTGASNYSFSSLGDGTGAGIIKLGYGGQGSNFLLNSSAIAPLVLNHRQLDIGGTRSSIVNSIGDPAKSSITININTDLLFTGAGSRTLSLDGPNAGDNTIAGKIPDGLPGTVISMEKNGIGKWILSGANTYTGSTTVFNGTLLVNGDQSLATGAVAVNGGTLGGNGSIGGNVTVATAANLAPGASAGTLSIGGNLEISAMAGGAGLLKFELNTIAASDKIVLATGKVLTIGSGALGLSDFNFTDLGGLQNGTYTLIQTDQTISGSLAGDTNGTLGSATIDLQISGDGTDLELVVSGLAGGDAFATWAAAAGLDGTPGKENGKADDPDGDGRNNNYEFAFNGDPLDGSDNGMVAGLVQDASAPAGSELTLVVAVRDGATFTGSGTPVVQSNTTPVDGLTYTIEGSLDLASFPGSDVSHVGGPSATAPVATGLPDLTGTAWKYHTFKLVASEGLGSKGFLRAKVE